MLSNNPTSRPCACTARQRRASRSLLLGLLLAAAAAGVRAGSGKQQTQARCICLPSWKDAAGKPHNGCANPNDDPQVPACDRTCNWCVGGTSASHARALPCPVPGTHYWHVQGEWCAVDADSCPGFYGSYTAADGTVTYYDYCSSVRGERPNACAWLLPVHACRAAAARLTLPFAHLDAERTLKGCLCAPFWNMGDGSGLGKRQYRNGCAHPETRKGASGAAVGCSMAVVAAAAAAAMSFCMQASTIIIALTVAHTAATPTVLWMCSGSQARVPCRHCYLP